MWQFFDFRVIEGEDVGQRRKFKERGGERVIFEKVGTIFIIFLF